MFCLFTLKKCRFAQHLLLYAHKSIVGQHFTWYCLFCMIIINWHINLSTKLTGIATTWLLNWETCWSRPVPVRRKMFGLCGCFVWVESAKNFPGLVALHLPFYPTLLDWKLFTFSEMKTDQNPMKRTFLQSVPCLSCISFCRCEVNMSMLEGGLLEHVAF